ncbi:MAG TPA: glycine cleavage T C-terminal barrel domain-containing protein [Candidatus Saccharimonadales bacterium]|nr:glycine cleavage T C-terminal barrel domain-containing protein [Candidatus Saccharimonadales bacterium]
MALLLLHEFHQSINARFTEVNGQEAVLDYNAPLAEKAALDESAGVLDLSFRGRLCVLGTDRAKFLNGQVTNNVKDLKCGEGCYAALVSAKGKIQSDLHIYVLENEILLDFEPGLNEAVQQRLQKYIIAEDAGVTDVSPHYGLLSVQGPKAAAVVQALPWNFALPEKPGAVAKSEDATLGEIYLSSRSRTRSGGYDLFVPVAAMQTVLGQLIAEAQKMGGRPCGWRALETARVEAGLPRFGVDMDETNLAPEVLDTGAISYSKGCYIGQEVIARVRTYGQVAKAFRGFLLPGDLNALPGKGDKLFLNEKEVGYITSAVASPFLKANIALGYVRREANGIGTELQMQTASAKVPVMIVELPFNLNARPSKASNLS